MKKSQKRLVEIFIFLLIVVVVNFATAKGREGNYEIHGVMYDSLTMRPIANSMFVFNQKDTIYTNKEGYFSYKMRWSAVEKPPFFWQKRKYKEAEERLNPEFILIDYGSKTNRFKNDWRRYGINSKSKEEKRVRVDFYWS